MAFSKAMKHTLPIQSSIPTHVNLALMSIPRTIDFFLSSASLSPPTPPALFLSHLYTHTGTLLSEQGLFYLSNPAGGVNSYMNMWMNKWMNEVIHSRNKNIYKVIYSFSSSLTNWHSLSSFKQCMLITYVTMGHESKYRWLDQGLWSLLTGQNQGIGQGVRSLFHLVFDRSHFFSFTVTVAWSFMDSRREVPVSHSLMVLTSFKVSPD